MTKNIIRLGKPRVLSTLVFSTVAALLAALATWGLLTNQVQNYWVVTTDAPIGAELATLPLGKVSATLIGNGSNYLSSSQKPIGYLTKPLRAGELISSSGISEIPIGEFARVVVPISSTLPSSVGALSDVEVWVASRFGTEFGPAAQLLESAMVIREVTSDNMFQQQHQQLDLQIDKSAVPFLLDAIANDSAIYLIPKS